MRYRPLRLRPIALVAIAAAALALGACGSSSSSSSSSSSTRSRAATSIAGKTKSADGTFAATMPSGFTNQTGSAQGGAINVLLLAVGPRLQGETININVIHEQARGQNDIDHIAGLELTGIKSLVSRAHSFSPMRSLTVDSAPARAVDYLGSPAGHMLHLAQVFVLHGGWIYTVTYTALPSTYQGHLKALGQLLGGWVWI
jgi:hypothetical protein